MPGPRLIAFEGLPFTGKSTTAAALQCEQPAATVVPDYHELIPPSDRSRMATPPESANDQHGRLSVYRKIDDQRWVHASRPDSALVLFDRCFLSITTYTMALSRTFDRDLPPEPPDQARSNGDIRERRIPPEIVYFDIDLDVAIDRHRRWSTSIDVRLRSREFLANLLDAYKEVLAMCGSDIIVVDSNRPLDELVKSVRGYVYGKDPD